MGPQQDRPRASKPHANGAAAPPPEGRKPEDGGGKVQVVRYRECQRNHAAAIGGHAVDGCREFMASAAAPADGAGAGALVCAACGCHRSFHRREVEVEFDAAAECDYCSSATSGDRRRR